MPATFISAARSCPGMKSSGPLTGIRVLDLTQAMAGPFASMILADLGADVVKIEPPSGDQTRAWVPPAIYGRSAYFLSINRGKKSVIVDLKKAGGIEILKRAVSACDILIENFRPGTMERLGLPHSLALKLNPRLIYCSISGYGQTGPLKNWPGYDLTVLAYSGLLSINAEKGRAPIKFGVPIADIISGLFASTAILSALYERTVSGKGQFIDTSMLDSNFYILTHQAMNYFATGRNPELLNSSHPSISPYQVFHALDGYIAIAVGTENLWRKFCEAIDREDLITDSSFSSNEKRVENRDFLARELEAVFSHMDVKGLLARMLAAGVPAAPINSVSEAAGSEQILARGMVTELEAPYGRFRAIGNPFKMSRTSGMTRLHPPDPGENTIEFLTNLGYSEEEVNSLLSEGVVIQHTFE